MIIVFKNSEDCDKVNFLSQIADEIVNVLDTDKSETETYNKLFRPFNGQQSACAQIYANTYNDSIDHVNKMAKVLQKDFNVNLSNIAVKKYGGSRIKGITFVEVMMYRDVVKPDSYIEIKEIEYIL